MSGRAPTQYFLQLEPRARLGKYLRHMKSLAIIAISIFASVQFCSADLFGDFRGTWTQNGSEAGSKITTIYKRLGKKGLIATTTIVLPGVGKSVDVTRYFDNGKIKGELRRDGFVRSTLTGTWSVVGNSLKAKTKVSAPLFPTFKENIKTTLSKTDKITTVATSSTGASSSAVMFRDK